MKRRKFLNCCSPEKRVAPEHTWESVSDLAASCLRNLKRLPQASGAPSSQPAQAARLLEQPIETPAALFKVIRAIGVDHLNRRLTDLEAGRLYRQARKIAQSHTTTGAP